MGGSSCKLCVPRQASVEMHATSEEVRLREGAESGSDPQAMAAYSRFLKTKMGDDINGNLWKRRAVECLAAKLSPTVTGMELYFHLQRF